MIFHTLLRQFKHSQPEMNFHQNQIFFGISRKQQMKKKIESEKKNLEIS